MRTTTKRDWNFSFTISDLGRLLGKSPVTLRGWERNEKHHIDIPRDSGGDRKLATEDVRAMVNFAQGTSRISTRRANLIQAIMTLLEHIEYENNRSVKK